MTNLGGMMTDSKRTSHTKLHDGKTYGNIIRYMKIVPRTVNMMVGHTVLENQTRK